MTKTLSPLTTRTLDIAAKGGDLIQFLGTVRIPSEPVIIEGADETDWIVLDARIDPHFQQRQLGMPRRCVRHLRTIQKSGIDFDGFLIGHELPAGTVRDLDKRYPGSKPTDLKIVAELIGPPPTKDSTENLTKAAEMTSSVIAKTALGLGFAAGAVAAAPLIALAAVASSLDPVLFGLVTGDATAKPGSLATVFYLTSWTH